VDQEQTTLGTVYYPEFGSDSNRGSAQTFQPAYTAKICNVKVLLKKVGSPTDDVYLEIHDGEAAGTLLAEADSRISGTSLATSNAYYDFQFTDGPELTTDETYAIVLYRSGSLDNSNYYRTGRGYSADTDLYTRGRLYWKNSSDNWINSGGDPDYVDMYF